ncbi:MAG: hypothetical protein ACOX5R_23080 [bacterium]
MPGEPISGSSGDFDGDGLIDLIIGVSDWRDYGWDNAYNENGEWANGPLHGYVYWAKNSGTNENPVYKKAKKIEADGEPIDVYGCPSPNSGGLGWRWGSGISSVVSFWTGLHFLRTRAAVPSRGTRSRRQGSVTPVRGGGQGKGQFLQADGEVIRMELEMLQVTALDWDQDGDPDIVVGQEDGRVALIENIGKGTDGKPILSAPVFFRQKADYVKCGALVTPCSIDWDDDGDEDLICGNTAGFIEWIENLDGGNPPKWAAPRRLKAEGQVIRFMAGENLSIQGPAEAKWGYTVPYVADWNMDGPP